MNFCSLFGNILSETAKLDWKLPNLAQNPKICKLEIGMPYINNDWISTNFEQFEAKGVTVDSDLFFLEIWKSIVAPLTSK